MKKQIVYEEPQRKTEYLFNKRNILLIVIGIIIILSIIFVVWNFRKTSRPTTTTTTTTIPTTTTTKAPTTTTLPEPTFLDNFDEFELADNWETPRTWEISQSDDARSAPNLLKTEEGKMVSIGGDEWGDYIFEVKGKILQGGLGYGLMFRTQKTETFYKYYSCQYDPGFGGILLTKKSNGQETALDVVEYATDSEWHIIKIEAVVNEFKCYVDGELVATATDDDFTYGKLGIELWGAEAYFDDVIVTSLEKTLWQ